jgi:holo-[acyl-carrier protein] synthase
MIIGLGVDLINADRIESLLEGHQGRFLEKYFTPAEINKALNMRNRKNFTYYLTKRFAAKEAFVKALGTGLRGGMRFSEIEVLNDDLGKPFLTCTGIAKDKLDAMIPKGKTAYLHVSISDDPPFVQTMVMIEAR